MKHIIKHGFNHPTVNDLDERQLGIAESDNTLWTKIGNEYVCLNEDHSEINSGNLEIKKFAFNGQNSSNYETSEIISLEDFKIDVTHSGYKIGNIGIESISGAPISILKADNTNSRIIGNAFYPGDEAFSEFLISVNNGTYNIKGSIYQNSSSLYSIVILEYLDFSSNGEEIIL